MRCTECVSLFVKVTGELDKSVPKMPEVANNETPSQLKKLMEPTTAPISVRQSVTHNSNAVLLFMPVLFSSMLVPMVVLALMIIASTGTSYICDGTGNCKFFIMMSTLLKCCIFACLD